MGKTIGKRVLKLLLFGLAMLLITERKAQDLGTSTMSMVNVPGDYHQIVMVVLVGALLWFATD